MNNSAEHSYAASPGSVVEIAARIRSGATTPSDVVQGYLERIAAVDGAVQAWVSVDESGALAAASEMTKEAANGAFRGPLHGVPVAIKDICDVAGWPTRCNSATRANAENATADADIVASLRNAGAIVLGKTHTTEFAYYDPSPARNPHNINHTPGGSSSGSGGRNGSRHDTGSDWDPDRGIGQSARGLLRGVSLQAVDTESECLWGRPRWRRCMTHQVCTGGVSRMPSRSTMRFAHPILRLLSCDLLTLVLSFWRIRFLVSAPKRCWPRGTGWRSNWWTPAIMLNVCHRRFPWKR